MTGPFLSLAQIRNRLILTARAVLRDHRSHSDGRCRVCRIPECSVATAARDVIRVAQQAEPPARSASPRPLAVRHDQPGRPSL